MSVQDLKSHGSLSKQQVFDDIVALASARRGSLTTVNPATINKGAGAGREQPSIAQPGTGLRQSSEAVGDIRADPVVRSSAARAYELVLESELQKVMTRADINSAVRTWNQLDSATAKLKTPADFRVAMEKPAKRPDAVRALAGRIDRATNESEMADVRKLFSTVGAAPIGSTNLLDLLLDAQHSDALTGACASLVLSQATLPVEQAEQMMKSLSEQRRITSTDPIIQHLLDLASQFASRSQPGVKSIR